MSRFNSGSVSSCATANVHCSQFPDRVRRDLVNSLRSRQIQHKFHYDSHKQAAKWLRLHQAYSPSRTDADCARIYDESFASVAVEWPSESVHLLGLGCGGGQKDARLLKLLQDAGHEASYTPVDASLPLTLIAREAALAVRPQSECVPMVCDLGSSEDPAPAIHELTPPGIRRLITFFGMLPNFDPEIILPRLAGLVRPGDRLLFSANLAPGPDYAAGVERVLPLYDNDLTRDWLLTLLLDMGLDARAGEMLFTIEHERTSGLRRIAAHFRFLRKARLQLEDQSFEFSAGESIRLFFSYRHTPASVRALLAQQGLEVSREWIANSGEEGVFLVARR